MAVYAGQGRQPFTVAQLAAMEEERKKRLAMAKANQAIMFEKDRTWKDKLAGRKSIQGQYWEAYPESAPRGLLDEFIYRNMTTSNWAGAPENRMNNASIWAEKEIIEQENARAAAAEEAAKFGKWGQVDQQTWTPGLGAPQIQPRVEEEMKQSVTGIVPPTEFNFSQGKQLSDEDFGRTYYEGAMDASNATKIPFTNKYIPGQYPYKVAGRSLDPELSLGEKLTSPNFWWGGLDETAMKFWNETRFGNTPGLLTAPSEWAEAEIIRQEEEQEAKRVAESEAGKEALAREAEVKRQRMMGDAMSSYENRPTPSLMSEESKYSLPQRTSLLGPELDPYVGLPFEGGPKTPEQKMIDGLNPDVKAQMDAMRESNAAAQAQKDLEAYNAQINNPTADDIAVLKAPEEITVEEDILPAVDGTIRELTDDEKNDKYVEATLNGETLLGKFLDMIGVLDNDNDGVSQEKGNEIVNDIAKIAGQESAAEVKQSGDGVLVDTDGTKKNVTGTSTTGTSTTGSVTIPSLMTTTSDDGMGGFTMDRLMNPLSPENKKWWMGGGGGVPGSNRAVQFFEALAYIGTPLKYRPAKTPGQQNIDNQITHMNNLMDYQSSMASSSASANQNTFTKLKAAIPSTADLEKSLAPAFYDNAGMFEKSSETDRKIKARAYELHEKMTILASQGIYPTLERVYADEAKAEEERKLAEERRKIEEQKNNTTPVNEESWWSDLWPFN